MVRDIPSIETRNMVRTQLLVRGVQTGDMIFRYGAAMHLGVFPFSKIARKLWKSPWSHVALIKIWKDEIFVVDMSNEGFRDFKLVDWMLETHEGGKLLVKALKPEYEKFRMSIDLCINYYKNRDIPYDFAFKPGDDELYCAEVVHAVYKKAGLPVPDKMSIDDMPGYRWYHWVICKVAGIDQRVPIVFPGNDEIGLASSQVHYDMYEYDGEKSS